MVEFRFTPAAERFFKKIKEKGLKKAFFDGLERIAKDPFVGEAKTGDLAGIYCLDVYYNKTNYEIAYRVYEENNRIVVVLLDGT